ncbi:nucleotidyltransferase family protein [Adhaeribacter radiodurans]|uniref:Nucleotidyltransferase n=1 Tax=Adhaeribacter radiodurans TaxID=2745197 RepID=A0A7L7LAB7_9BACT|nr:sugar phosphate nucleotidyltransferase [Adhaeribacter radiodurans]QMU29349.1 nucleotidyltransferase [Adhaeribacter radiodurans]
MRNAPSLVILAAGMGSRYGGLKQLDTFGPNGETIIDYSVYDAIRAGFSKIVFVIRKSLEQEFIETILAKLPTSISVELAFQDISKVPGNVSIPETRRKPWGTGHAVWTVGGQVNEPFAVINADDFYGFAAFQQMADFLKNTDTSANLPAWCLSGYALVNTLSKNGTVSRGLCKVNEENKLLSVRELKEIERNENEIVANLPEGKKLTLTGQEIVSMNFWGFTPAIFPILNKYLAQFLEKYATSEKDEFYLSEAVNQMLMEKRASVQVLISSDQWMGVTYPEDKMEVKQQLAELIARGAYPSKLWENAVN